MKYLNNFNQFCQDMDSLEEYMNDQTIYVCSYKIEAKIINKTSFVFQLRNDALNRIRNIYFRSK